MALSDHVIKVGQTVLMTLCTVLLALIGYLGKDARDEIKTARNSIATNTNTLTEVKVSVKSMEDSIKKLENARFISREDLKASVESIVTPMLETLRMAMNDLRDRVSRVETRQERDK